jgi:hypothetical protein
MCESFYRIVLNWIQDDFGFDPFDHPRKKSKMKFIESKQKFQKFSWCPHPVTIDKSADWGPGNKQEFPEGVFLKHQDACDVTHGVQPNTDKTAPVGWVKSDLTTAMYIGSTYGLFDKCPIWVEDETLKADTTVNTLDGVIDYKYDPLVPSVICYNGDASGPNMADAWVQTVKNVEKNYVL